MALCALFVVLIVLVFVGAVVLAALDRCKGRGPEPTQPKSGPVPGGGFVWIAAGGSESCAQTKTGELWCWGAGHAPVRQTGPANGAGAPYQQFAVHELGRCGIDGAHVLHCDRISSAPVIGWITLPKARKVVLGKRHGCVIRDDSSLWCFGPNDAHQVDATTSAWVDQPVRVSGAVKDVALGIRHTCALLDSGKVQCWGNNDDRQTGPVVQDELPQEVLLPGPATQVAVGDTQSCALLNDGSVFCWGRDPVDASKIYGPRTSPMRLVLEAKATQLASSERTGCAMIGNRTLKCWGDSYRCALRDYYCFPSEDPPFRQLGAPAPATQLVVADEHSCVLLESGDIACAGSQDKKQLGNVLPFVSATHYSHHAESCNTEVWEEPPGWPDLLPIIW